MTHLLVFKFFLNITHTTDLYLSRPAASKLVSTGFHDRQLHCRPCLGTEIGIYDIASKSLTVSVKIDRIYFNLFTTTLELMARISGTPPPPKEFPIQGYVLEQGQRKCLSTENQ